VSSRDSFRSSPETEAGMAIEHTAVMQLRGRSFGPPTTRSIYVPLPITRSEKGPSREQTRMAGKQLIGELKPGEKVDSYFSVNYKKPVSDYKYGFMFELRVADLSGQMTAKYWGGTDRELVDRIYSHFGRDDVVRIKGEVADYRGQLEMSINEKNGGEIQRLEEGSYDVTCLVRKLDNIEDMKNSLLEMVGSVSNPDLRRLLDAFFSDREFLKEFAFCPASIQLHSAAIGGLLQHTLNVARISMDVVNLHPELDRDLVITGALLHDIGKLRSFKVTTNIGQTHEGNLLGHVVLGDQELEQRIARIEGFKPDLREKIRHILVAHHGKKDWGSPVEPMFPEALLVHEADNLDAKLDYMIARKRDAMTEDDWIWDARLGRLIYLG